MFEFVDKLKYGYGQTKWLSEQVVSSAAKNGLPVIITRWGHENEIYLFFMMKNYTTLVFTCLIYFCRYLKE